MKIIGILFSQGKNNFQLTSTADKTLIHNFSRKLSLNRIYNFKVAKLYAKANSGFNRKSILRKNFQTFFEGKTCEQVIATAAEIMMK